jgi:hypothetical protein
MNIPRQAGAFPGKPGNGMRCDLCGLGLIRDG